MLQIMPLKARKLNLQIDHTGQPAQPGIEAGIVAPVMLHGDIHIYLTWLV